MVISIEVHGIIILNIKEPLEPQRRTVERYASEKGLKAIVCKMNGECFRSLTIWTDQTVSPNSPQEQMHQEVPKNLRVPSIDLQAALATVNESVHQATIKKQAAQIVQNGHLLRVLEGQSHSPDLNPVVML